MPLDYGFLTLIGFSFIGPYLDYSDIFFFTVTLIFSSKVCFCTVFGKSGSCDLYCVKSLRIRSFSCLYFPAFGLNTERYGVSLRIQSECGKIWTRKNRNTDTFQAVLGLAFTIGRFLIQTPLSALPELGTQICYKIPRDLWSKGIRSSE